MGEHVTVDGPAALHVVPGADHSEEQRDHSCPFACQLSREQIQRQEPQTAGDQERRRIVTVENPSILINGTIQ